jgi:hypothetical protein
MNFIFQSNPFRLKGEVSALLNACLRQDEKKGKSPKSKWLERVFCFVRGWKSKPKKELPAQQRSFVENYLADPSLHATQAALKAGYSPGNERS